MYYPYLRARQFELIALREYAQQRGNNNFITPIIEPVKKTFNNFKLALPILSENDVKFALILNPQAGEIKKNKARESFNLITSELETELNDNSKWIHTFIISNNYIEIYDIVNEHNLNDVMLICSETTDSTNDDFIQLVNLDSIKYIVSKENRSLKRAVRGKDFIRLDDNFKAQKRNVDYLSIGEEKFTEEHLFFTEDGYVGFSDYTPLNSDFAEGGSTPYSVAIHLTYKKSNNEVWIRHFVSETGSDNNYNIQGKFAEAAKKANDFINSKNISTNATLELKRYYEDAKYPGLGMIKKISIKHHLELMNV